MWISRFWSFIVDQDLSYGKKKPNPQIKRYSKSPKYRNKVGNDFRVFNAPVYGKVKKSDPFDRYYRGIHNFTFRTDILILLTKYVFEVSRIILKTIEILLSTVISNIVKIDGCLRKIKQIALPITL